ncbi:hypothetical protein ACVILK_005321 [Bradyrhizobium embrapense]
MRAKSRARPQRHPQVRWTTFADNAQQLTPALAFDVQAVAGEWLACGDKPDLPREIGGSHQAAGLLVEVRDLKQPSSWLSSGMFARDAVEPALDPAGQAK